RSGPGGAEPDPPWLADGPPLQDGVAGSLFETPRWASASPEEKRALEENLRFAEDLCAEPVRVHGSDVAKSLMQVSHDRNVGSIIIGHSRHGRAYELLKGSTVHKLMRLAGDIDVHVVANRGDKQP